MTSVLRLQQALNGNGFDPGPLDGISGPKTTAAVRAFQRARGLAVDGIPGPRTRAALGLTNTPVQVPDYLPWMQEAYRLLGTKETPGRGNTPAIMAWAEGLDLVQYTGDDIPWCGLFVAHCIASGLPREVIPGVDDMLVARRWRMLGAPAAAPQFGDVVTYWRGSPDGWSGHVGFWVGSSGGYDLVLGGNQSDAVTIAKLAVGRRLEVRRPVTAPKVPADAPRLMAAAGGAVLSVNEA